MTTIIAILAAFALLVAIVWMIVRRPAVAGPRDRRLDDTTIMPGESRGGAATAAGNSDDVVGGERR